MILERRAVNRQPLNALVHPTILATSYGWDGVAELAMELLAESVAIFDFIVECRDAHLREQAACQ